MNIVRRGIPLFRKIGESFYMGSDKDNKIEFTLTKGFLVKHLPLGETIKMYSTYPTCKNEDDISDYIVTIFNDQILRNVYRRVGVEVATISGILGDEGVYIDIDDSKSSGKLLLDLLDKNKVFATLIYQIDSSFKNEIFGIETVALCLGCMNDHILFI